MQFEILFLGMNGGRGGGRGGDGVVEDEEGFGFFDVSGVVVIDAV